MKLELYNINDIHGKAIKLFLTNNGLKFNEIITQDINLLNKIAQIKLKEKISLLRIKQRHNIGMHVGFNEHLLNQLLDHIKKYNPRLE